jgi:hypothetical protein
MEVAQCPTILAPTAKEIHVISLPGIIVQQKNIPHVQKIFFEQCIAKSIIFARLTTMHRENPQRGLGVLPVVGTGRHTHVSAQTRAEERTLDFGDKHNLSV